MEGRLKPADRAVNKLALSRLIAFSGGSAAFIALLAALYQATNSARLAGLLVLRVVASLAAAPLMSATAAAPPVASTTDEITTRGEPARQLSAEKIRNELAGRFTDLQVRQVAYDLCRLRDVDLLPRPIPGG